MPGAPPAGTPLTSMRLALHKGSDFVFKYAPPMIEIVEVKHPGDKAGREFLRFPFVLYANSPCWVPPFKRGIRKILAKKHPLFEHADGAFFTAFDGERTVGRIAVIENTLEPKESRIANFCLFDCVDSQEAASLLFEAAESWAKARSIDEMAGPKFSSGTFGLGVLVEGFEYRAAMTMSGYNYAYYENLIKGAGYVQSKDYFSAIIDVQAFAMPDRISRIAKITEKRGHFEVLKFSSKRELKKISGAIGEMHNLTLGQATGANHLTDREVAAIRKDLLAVADPALIKILTYDAKVVGFLFTFHDVSAALQRGKGRLGPVSILRLVRDAKKSKDLIVNGIGILQEYQRLGGNALLYKELERTVSESVKDARSAELVQIAETTWLMLSDLESLGARVHKKHRVYEKRL